MRANDPIFTAPIASMAAGIPEKALRNRMDRGQISLRLVTDGERRIAKFGLLDCLSLAVAERLIRYGVSVDQAHKISKFALSGAIAAIQREPNPTGSEIASAFEDFQIRVFHGGAGTEPRWDTNTGDAPLVPDILIIRVSLIFGEVIKRLQAHLNSGDLAIQLAKFSDVFEEVA